MKDKTFSHGWNTEVTRIHPWPPPAFACFECFVVCRPPTFPTHCRTPEKTDGQKTDSYYGSTRVLLSPCSIPTRVLLRSYSHPGLQNPKKTGEFSMFWKTRKTFLANRYLSHINASLSGLAVISGDSCSHSSSAARNEIGAIMTWHLSDPLRNIRRKTPRRCAMRKFLRAFFLRAPPDAASISQSPRLPVLPKDSMPLLRKYLFLFCTSVTSCFRNPP